MREADVSPAKLPLPSCDHDSSGLFWRPVCLDKDRASRQLSSGRDIRRLRPFGTSLHLNYHAR